MTPAGRRSSAVVASAMICSGVVTAQFVASKATRDALYLAHLDVTTLPAMVIATAAVSILLVIGSSKALRQLSPAAFVPLVFTLSAVAFLLNRAMVYTAPRTTAVA